MSLPDRARRLNGPLRSSRQTEQTGAIFVASRPVARVSTSGQGRGDAVSSACPVRATGPFPPRGSRDRQKDRRPSTAFARLTPVPHLARVLHSARARKPRPLAAAQGRTRTPPLAFPAWRLRGRLSGRRRNPGRGGRGAHLGLRSRDRRLDLGRAGSGGGRVSRRWRHVRGNRRDGRRALPARVRGAHDISPAGGRRGRRDRRRHRRARRHSNGAQAVSRESAGRAPRPSPQSPETAAGAADAAARAT